MSIKSSRVFAALTAAVVAGAGIGAAPAFAEDVRTVTVDYRDLDMHSAAGQQQLARRIAYAATRVCDTQDTSLDGRSTSQRCTVDAKNRANAELSKVSVPGA